MLLRAKRWVDRHRSSHLLRRAAETGRRVLAMGIGCAFISAGLGFERVEPTERRAPADCEYDKPLSVVLIAIDGVRWQDIFQGADANLLSASGVGHAEAPKTAEQLAPNIHALARRGVAIGGATGEPFSASGPNFVSLPGYAELLQGRPARCFENDCRDTLSFTILDAFSGEYEPERVAAFSSWTNIERVAASPSSTALVSAGRTGGWTRDALLTSDSKVGALVKRAQESPVDVLGGDYRSDAHTADIALQYLESSKPRFMFVSLGDTDEHAHHGRYTNYLEALGRADAFVGDVVRITRAWEAEGVQTLVVVTTDHGRADDFEHHGRDYAESARTWLVAAGGPLPSRGYVPLREPRFLRDVAPTIAAIAGLPLEMTPSSGQVLTELAPTCAGR